MLHKPVRFLAPLVLSLVTIAVAQKHTPPEGGPPKDFKLPETETFTLDNGLTATLIPYGILPKVTVRTVIRVGNLNEAADQIWLADLTGDFLKEGTATRSSEEIARAAAEMGGELTINVTPDQSLINGDVLSEFGPDMVRLQGDVARNPAFPESELERLVNDLVRQVSIQKSQPGSLALERFRKLLYPDHPYGRIFPTEELLRSYTVEGIRAFYEANFGAARTHVYVSGRFSAGKIKVAIRKAFGDWTTGNETLVNIPDAVTQRVIHLVDRPGASQSTLYIGLPVINSAHEDYVKLLVTNTLLGGFFSSRITANIREDKGYTYSPFSSVSSRYRDAYWVEIADVGTEVTEAALREIFYEIDRLQDKAPPEDELKGVQNYMAGTFVLRNSSRTGIINQLMFLALHGLDKEYLTGYVKNVHAVTPETVQQMAGTYLADENMTLVVVGDREQVLSQLATFGEVIE
jgi:predicted Zn-dependent peptidase